MQLIKVDNFISQYSINIEPCCKKGEHVVLPPINNKKHSDSSQISLGVRLFGQEGKGESSLRPGFLNPQNNTPKEIKNISSKIQDKGVKLVSKKINLRFRVHQK